MKFYLFAAQVLRIMLKIKGVKIIGKENIPAKGPYLIIANHLSVYDPILVGTSFKDPITFIAKEGLSKNKFGFWLFKRLGVVFLNKDDSDLAALRTSLRVLAEQKVVGLFPEGHRNRQSELLPFLPGTAYIAGKAQVPVVPVGLSNSFNFFKFWRRDIIVRIGQPIACPPKGKLNEEQLVEISSHYRATITNLIARNIDDLINVKS